MKIDKTAILAVILQIIVVGAFLGTIISSLFGYSWFITEILDERIVNQLENNG